MRVCRLERPISTRLHRLDLERLLPFCCPDAARSSRGRSRRQSCFDGLSRGRYRRRDRRGRRPLGVVAAASGESTLAHIRVLASGLGTSRRRCLRQRVSENVRGANGDKAEPFEDRAGHRASADGECWGAALRRCIPTGAHEGSVGAPATLAFSNRATSEVDGVRSEDRGGATNNLTGGESDEGLERWEALLPLPKLLRLTLEMSLLVFGKRQEGVLSRQRLRHQSFTSPTRQNGVTSHA